jgi:thermopsin
MRVKAVFLSILAVLLLSSGGFVNFAGVLGSSAASTIIPPQQSFSLRQGYFEYVEVDSFANNTWLLYNVTSDYPISVALMNPDQLSSFSNVANDPVSNSITYQNGTNIVNDIQIPLGQYFLVFYAYSQRAQVQFGYNLFPNTPYSYGAVSSPQPSGIASFGINNDSGTASPYEIKTNQIVGLANISSILANNPNAPSIGDNVAGATLQLNANLVVNLTDGLQNVYWVQNTPDFVTSVNQVALTDNLWNSTDISGVMSNQSVVSPNYSNGGAVYISTSQGSNSYAYLYSANNVTYATPFSFALVENESVQSGKGVLVQLGFRMLQNGSSISSSKTNWFDNITINLPDVKSAYFDVAGNATTPIGSFYDAELVFAGEGNFESTQFLNMSSSLGLFYQDQITGKVVSFPSYYSFGGDTGEASSNLTVAYSNGIAYLTVGNPNYVYLGKSSLTLSPSYLLPLSIFNTPGNGFSNNITTTTQSLSGSQTTTRNQATTTSAASSSSVVSQSISPLLIGGIIVVLVIVVGTVAFLASRRKKIKQGVETVQNFPAMVPTSIAKHCPHCGTELPGEALYCSDCGAPQHQSQI